MLRGAHGLTFQLEKIQALSFTQRDVNHSGNPQMSCDATIRKQVKTGIVEYMVTSPYVDKPN